MTPSMRLHFLASVCVLIFLALFSSSSSSSSCTTVDSSCSSGTCFISLLRVDGLIKRKTLSEKELGEIEDQWMEDEEEDEDDTPFKYKKTAEGGRIPPSPAGPKTEMGFVTLKGKDKKKTDELAGRWSDQMLAAGIDVRGYSIEENRILFVCDQRGFKDMNKVRAFVLRQSETEEFEWNNKKSHPGDIATDEEGGEAEVSDPLAKFQAMQEEAQQQAKREAKKKKKAEQERKRKAEKAKKQAAEKKKKEEAKKKKEAEEKKKKEAEAAAAAKPQEKTEL